MSDSKDSEQRLDTPKKESKFDTISIVYHQRNDSPKFFEIKRSRVYLFFIGLPAITLIAAIIGIIGLLNTSPFHLMDSYRENSKNRSNLAAALKVEELENESELQKSQNAQLKSEVSALQDKLNEQMKNAGAAQTATAVVNVTPTTTSADGKCPAPVACPAPPVSGTINSIGLSTLSLFKPIQGQKDRTRPATLTLSGFKTSILRDTVNLQFNIIPTTTDETKVSGHIVVLMKNELAIQTYPLQALGGSDFQVNYSAGEPFATQRFRPVDASFVKPRKSGNYHFTVFIFSRTGDLIHFQSVNAALKL